eukprot:COSAG01_NODE_8782_length_2661_cov_2.311085_4_plen_57_part_00
MENVSQGAPGPHIHNITYVHGESLLLPTFYYVHVANVRCRPPCLRVEGNAALAFQD